MRLHVRNSRSFRFTALESVGVAMHRDVFKRSSLVIIARARREGPGDEERERERERQRERGCERDCEQ